MFQKYNRYKWNVKQINFGVSEFGWSASKIFFYTDERFFGEQFLVIDADIIFTGYLIDKLQQADSSFDFIDVPSTKTR